MMSHSSPRLRTAILSLMIGAGALLAASDSFVSPYRPQRGSQFSAPTERARIHTTFSQLPLSFEPNQGQTDQAAQFIARGQGYTLYLNASEATLALRGGRNQRPAAVRLKLIDAAADSVAEPINSLPGKSNYFIGNDPRQWRTDVPAYAGVRYRGVYDGVDLVY